jgi:hypothetical protein
MSSFLQQLPNFPAFTWSQDALQPVLLRLRLKQGKLLGRMESFQSEFRELANTEMIKADAAACLFMELGLNATEEQAKTAQLGSMIDLLKQTNQSYQTEFTKQALDDLHRTLGKLFSYQDIDNQYSNEISEAALDRFLVWFNKPGLDRILKAGIAHLWFLSINPYEKGAELLAGLISEIQLAKADGTGYRFYSMTAQIAQVRTEYDFLARQSLHGSLDITIWLQWYLSNLEKAYDAATIQLQPIFEKAHFWNAHSDIAFNKRQQAIIQSLLKHSNVELSSTIYAKNLNCSRDTALRDITDLLKKGVFMKLGGLGKNARYILKNI